MSNQNNNDPFDLGSEPINEDFDPFGSEADIGGNTSEDSTVADTAVPEESKPETSSPTDVTDNPLDSAVKIAEIKEAEKPPQGFADKPPVFEYAGATENIEDTSKTFDELRIEKSSDFPELEDGKRVSWTVEYGKIVKNVADPKGTSIGKMKSDIETSKEFTDSLKKAKDKNPACKVKPRVTAQSKGTASVYKGVFANMQDAVSAGKVISIVPSKDGKVYEIRNTEMGKFVTPVVGCELLSDVQAGFIPALPLIPMNVMTQIVTFFRHYMRDGVSQEALVNIYWDKKEGLFHMDVPEQTATKVSVDGYPNLNFANDRYIHYMDIHSHNNMKAFFSAKDDADEKATRLYSVVGRLDKYFPEIKTRISNGGKYWPIDPAEVFELISDQFPEDWKENVHCKTPNGDGRTLRDSDGDA